MQTYSLRTLIVRQWTVFAGCAALLLCGITLVAAYMVEDSLIDRRLVAAAASLSDDVPNTLPLPPMMRVYSGSEIPIDIADRAVKAVPREIVEMRRPDGRYVHVMRLANDSMLSVLVYDVSDSMVVASLRPNGIFVAVALTAIFILVAWAMANALAARIVRDTEQIADQLHQISDPSQLREIAARQCVSEIGHMLDIHAELWAQQHALIDSERTNLAYLGHELRTPMQSAINAHALLSESRNDDAAWQRLSRALSRLQRANNAMLWMASGMAASIDEPVRLTCVLQDLTEELGILARWRDKDFDVRIAGDPIQSVPREVVEVIFVNLLRNGIDHASDRIVGVTLSQTELIVANTVNPELRSRGFGIGLKIAQRLCEQAGWNLRCEKDAGVFVATINFKKE